MLTCLSLVVLKSSALQTVYCSGHASLSVGKSGFKKAVQRGRTRYCTCREVQLAENHEPRLQMTWKFADRLESMCTLCARCPKGENECSTLAST